MKLISSIKLRNQKIRPYTIRSFSTAGTNYLTNTFSALLHMYNLCKSTQSGCHFICKFPRLLHSQPTLLHVTPDLLLQGLVREIHLKLFLTPCPSTPLMPFLFISLSFSSAPFPFRFLCLNLLSLMSRSRESQAQKKGRGLTEIDV